MRRPLTWHGCYEGGWKDYVTPESFCHPAKMAYGLLARIIAHGFERGYWREGDLIADPFGGTGSTGIQCSYAGLRSISVELEPKFVELASDNFRLHAHAWTVLGLPFPVMLQGDSRQFAALVGRCEAAITSPPFVDQSPAHNKAKNYKGFQHVGSVRNGAIGYGYNEKNPYNIGNLKAGSVDAVISSPPYSDTRLSGGNTQNGQGHTQGHRCLNDYGVTPGQIGNTTKSTYWEAMRAVYEQVYLALKPHGVLCVVLKDYISKGQRVPLVDDSLRLLEAVGFEPLERVRAMLVKEERHADLFGGEIVKTKERKSFFRKLCEAKGSPKIDWEEVLFVRKPPGLIPGTDR